MKARTLKPVERPSRLFAAVLALVDRLQDGDEGAPVELPAAEWAELERLALKESADEYEARALAKHADDLDDIPITPRGTSVVCDDCGGVCEGDGTGQQLCTCAVAPPKSGEEWRPRFRPEGVEPPPRCEPPFSVKNLEATATTPSGYVANGLWERRREALDWATAEGWRKFEVYDSAGVMTDSVELSPEKPKRQRRAKAKAPAIESPSADATPSAPAAEPSLPFATDADTPPSAPEFVAGVYGGAS